MTLKFGSVVPLCRRWADEDDVWEDKTCLHNKGCRRKKKKKKYNNIRIVLLILMRDSVENLLPPLTDIYTYID